MERTRFAFNRWKFEALFPFVLSLFGAMTFVVAAVDVAMPSALPVLAIVSVLLVLTMAVAILSGIETRDEAR